ncbi:uncharacterized protein LY89DRAFT_647571 [Mollisia scopiformis]|uniref:CCZ1/INTU/HSP4 first Longin domain-containing protein n=1 Tax=Mollisia scopiformis TaxID=149040 RepID=A0A194X6I2_MOLSC|nr:uncharacterized protein LY89DRAFT_647571 [Mollisia scopiformis]KUJ15684.1 hypothetical protein LY89DRAFT_647571 [Mollisia scopiformis]
MSSTVDQSRTVIPAQLGFLAIYNPSLGTSDETIENQIVYYSSSSENARKSRQTTNPKQKAADDAAKREQQNEQLRQIGLAQGMVEFGRSFSDGMAVDTVETEKSRIILHELESGWWILASISLTVLPVIAKPASIVKGKSSEPQEAVEYSSREVKPAVLLLGDLLRAHATFLLHHASSMSALFVRTRRSKFVGLLGRYWDTFLSTWNVLMHGNPANSLYGGIKIAACGELGMGVGEEERGSGEREVLEGFVGRIDGLVDVVVSKFGDVHSGQETPKAEQQQNLRTEPTSPWLGSGSEPAAEDGAIFLGTGALSKKSLRYVTHWIEDLYRWGPYAYGVTENPTSIRHSKKSKKHQNRGESLALSPDTIKKSRQVYGLTDRTDSEQPSPDQDDSMATIAPQPMADSDASAGSPKPKKHRPTFRRGPGSFASSGSETGKTNKLVQYLKFGYGTHWTLGGSSLREDEVTGAPGGNPETKLDAQDPLPKGLDAARLQVDGTDEGTMFQVDDSKGHYLVGLMGDIENENGDSDDQNGEGLNDTNIEDLNARVVLRTLTLDSDHTGTTSSSYDSQDRNKTKKLRVVVYVNRPFIFVFLFELRTDALAWNNLYRAMHYQLAPLIKPLLSSTTFRASKPDITNTEDSTTPIYDLVWDPKLLTIRSTIPNIPDPYHAQTDPSVSLTWSRIEALNTHMQIVNTYITSTMDRSELERTCKTSRGWWVVWTRIPEPDSTPTVSLASGQVKVPGLIHEDSGETGPSNNLELPLHQKSRGGSTNASTKVSSMFSGPAHPFLEALANTGRQSPRDKEIFLIRRASDHAASKSRMLSGSSFSGSEGGWTTGPSKLAQGIGVDTKRYIESLLNLS